VVEKLTAMVDAQLQFAAANLADIKNRMSAPATPCRVTASRANLIELAKLGRVLGIALRRVRDKPKNSADMPPS